MNISSKSLIWVLMTALSLSLLACEGEDEEVAEPERYSIPIEGKLTVDPELDATGDYSGIHVRVLNIYRPETDTLYHAVTDTSGTFSGYAEFEERGEYLLEIKRGGNEIAGTELVLAEGDTIRIEAELPDFDLETVIESREFEAMAELNRLMNQFTRISTYISAGLVDEDEALDNLHTWNDLFWEHSRNHPGTLAADRAVFQAIGILDGWDNEKMFEQLASDPENEALIEAGIYHGVPSRVREGGLDEGLSYIDTLWERARHSGNRKLLGINRIEMLYDSARVGSAKDYLEGFKEEFGDEPDVQEWISSIEYDLNNLAPGMEAPDFRIPLMGNGELTNADLSGSPYIIEFVNYESPDYHFSFPELADISDQYAEDNLRIISIPTHDNQSTIDAFFSEREKKWDVAPAGVYADQELTETFNVDQIPVRILVNAEGRIVRKYYEAGITELVLDLNRQRHLTEIL